MSEELKPNTTPENGASGGEPISLRKKFFNFRMLISFILAIGLIIVIVNQCHIDFSQTWYERCAEDHGDYCRRSFQQRLPGLHFLYSLLG